MKHLELHIIQSVPVACLNRDDLNSPKTAVFGGVQRARVSSQSWKRAIREMAKTFSPEQFMGQRSRRMVFTLKNRFVDKDIVESCAIAIAEHIADIIETLDSKIDEDGSKKIKTMMFFSDAEYDAIVEKVVSAEDVTDSIDALKEALSQLESAIDKGEKKKAEGAKEKAFKAMKTLSKSSIAKMIKSAELKDAADIALFGRMVANDHSLSVEAASMFSHALSTHKADNEIDFFSAVDDLQTADESGAGMTGTLEFNSATYYRFAALNLDMLTDKDHLICMDESDRKSVVSTFIEATIKAIPGARRNTMNGNTMPLCVLGIVREKGHPIQLANAFERVVRPSPNGFAVKSINRMNSEYADLKETWGVNAVFEKMVIKRNLKDDISESLGTIKTCSLEELLEGMVSHVS